MNYTISGQKSQAFFQKNIVRFFTSARSFVKFFTHLREEKEPVKALFQRLGKLEIGLALINFLDKDTCINHLVEHGGQPLRSHSLLSAKINRLDNVTNGVKDIHLHALRNQRRELVILKLASSRLIRLLAVLNRRNLLFAERYKVRVCLNLCESQQGLEAALVGNLGGSGVSHSINSFQKSFCSSLGTSLLYHNLWSLSRVFLLFFNYLKGDSVSIIVLSFGSVLKTFALALALNFLFPFGQLLLQQIFLKMQDGILHKKLRQ